MKTKTYTNRFGRDMLLAEVPNTTKPVRVDVFHDYPVRAGASITLRHVPGIRRVWKRA